MNRVVKGALKSTLFYAAIGALCWWLWGELVAIPATATAGGLLVLLFRMFKLEALRDADEPESEFWNTLQWVWIRLAALSVLYGLARLLTHNYAAIAVGAGAFLLLSVIRFPRARKMASDPKRV